jgi:hypothetical protein
MVTTTTARLDTPTRWTAALDRAHAKGVKLFRDTATGVYSALSTDGRTLYSVSYYTCGCKAGQGADPVCLHRAAFRAHLLREDAIVEAAITPDPTPAIPAHVADLLVVFDETGEPESSDLLAPVEPDHRMCTSCLDTGWARMYLGFGLNDYTNVPCRCGAGVPVAETAYQAAAL